MNSCKYKVTVFITIVTKPHDPLGRGLAYRIEGLGWSGVYLEAHTLPFFRIPNFMVRICYLKK